MSDVRSTRHWSHLFDIQQYFSFYMRRILRGFKCIKSNTYSRSHAKTHSRSDTYSKTHSYSHAYTDAETNAPAPMYIECQLYPAERLPDGFVHRWPVFIREYQLR